MRTVAIDGERMVMISTGKVTAVVRWVEDGAGGRKLDPNGAQDTDISGLPLWRVEAIVPPQDPSDDRASTEVIEVTVALAVKPDSGTFGEVIRFERLVMMLTSLNRKTNSLGARRLSAAGPAGRSGGGRP